MSKEIRFKGIVATLAQIAADKFAGRIAWASDLARSVHYYTDSDYAVLARKDVAETFPGIKVTNQAGPVVRMVQAGTDGTQTAVGAAVARWTIGAQAALGYTPVNNAGDTMTGGLTLSAGDLNVGAGAIQTAGVTRISAGGAGSLTTLATTGLATLAQATVSDLPTGRMVSTTTGGRLQALDAAGSRALIGAVAASEKGAANGVAPLGADSKIASTYLPSYVDDVLEFASLAAFPATGESGKIYVAIDTAKTYRWSGSAYVVISETLALGETPSTAYRGDRGATAYTHSQATGNPHGTTFAQIASIPASIDAIDGLTPVADRIAYYTGANSAALAPLSAFGRSLIDDADQAAARATLGADDVTMGMVSATAGSAGKWAKVASFSVGAIDDFIALRLQVTSTYYGDCSGIWRIDIEPRNLAATGSPTVMQVESTGGMPAGNVVVVVASDYPSTRLYEIWVKCPANYSQVAWTIRDLIVDPGPSMTMTRYNAPSWETAYSAGTAYAGNDGKAYAEIYVADASTAQSIPTGTGWTKITAFTTNGESANATADATNDKITITRIGKYHVTMSASTYLGTANVTMDSTIFSGGSRVTKLSSTRLVTTASQRSSTCISGILNVTSVPIDIDLRVRHDNSGSVNITPVHINLNVEQIG